MNKNNYLKIIILGCLLVAGLLLLTGKSLVSRAQVDCLPLGSSCSVGQQCCSGSCIGPDADSMVCCQNTGGSCSSDSDCCFDFCDEGTNTCQACLPEPESCDRDVQCCSGSCEGGQCAEASSLEECMACGGDCIDQQLTKTCANGDVIILSYTSSGCGNCQVADPISYCEQLERCCIDDPTDCLYTCYYEESTGCDVCGGGMQCVRYWMEPGECPAEPGPPSTRCTADYCGELWPATQEAFCSSDLGYSYSCGPDRVYYGSRSTDDCNATAEDHCLCCGTEGSMPLSATLTVSPVEGCPSLNVTFTLAASGSNLDRWQLEYNDGTRVCNPGPCTVAANGHPDGKTYSHSYGSGIYSAVLTVWNSFNQTAVATRKVRVAIDLSHVSNTASSIVWDWPDAANVDSYQFYSGCYDRSENAAIGYYRLASLSGAVSSYTQTTWPLCEFGTQIWPLSWYRNFNNDVFVSGCKGSDCMPVLSCSRASAATSIQSPGAIDTQCLDDGNLLNISISSDYLVFGVIDFAYFHYGGGWGVNNSSEVKAKVERVSDSAIIDSISWPVDPPFGVALDDIDTELPLWPVNISPDVQYRVCAQSQNQDADPSDRTDFRPDAPSDWYCVPVNCPSPSCTPDTDAACCNNSSANVDATATRGAAPGASCVGAVGNSCWSLTGGFSFPDTINGEVYHNNCCGDDTGEYFISSSGVRQGINLINSANRSCDGSFACCDNQNDWVNAGACVASCPVVEEPCVAVVRVRTQNQGIVSLCVVAAGKAERGKGVVRVGLPGGGVGEADLVDVGHAKASPVRIRLNGVTKSWRKAD